MQMKVCASAHTSEWVFPEVRMHKEVERNVFRL